MGIVEALENAKKISNKPFAILENSDTLTYGEIYDKTGLISNLFKNICLFAKPGNVENTSSLSHFL